jgi:enoyl-CoA hydratase
MAAVSEIIFEEIRASAGSLGLITLNRPKSLNALNHDMFIALDQQLQTWDSSAHIQAVIIRAVEGRAFCAGGDMRQAYELGVKNDPQLAGFFADEYRMNSRVYHFSKPYIALLDGITMGGGAGISIHGSCRVATQRFKFAMPETGLGFFPDVGSTYFLARLKHHMGIYLGLTGAVISADDCLALNLVDFIVAESTFAEIIQTLQLTPLEKHADAAIAEVMRKFAKPAEKSALMQHESEIDTCFGNETLDEIMAALEAYPSAWCEEVVNTLALKSPTSLKVVLRQLQQGEKLTFDKALQMEYRLMSRFINTADLQEGVRAVLIDKDHKPVWNPDKIKDVSDVEVAKFFAPLATELPLD